MHTLRIGCAFAAGLIGILLLACPPAEWVAGLPIRNPGWRAFAGQYAGHLRPRRVPDMPDADSGER